MPAGITCTILQHGFQLRVFDASGELGANEVRLRRTRRELGAFSGVYLRNYSKVNGSWGELPSDHQT
jgi:hypothetical protein